MIQVDDHLRRILLLIHRLIVSIAMHAHALCGSKLNFHFVYGQIHRIVTCLGHFSTVTVPRAIGIRIETRQPRRWTARRHHQHIAIIAHARSAEVGVRKSVDKAVFVVIASAAIPTVIDAGIGRKLHHAERPNRPWKGMPMSARPHHRVHIVRRHCLCLGGEGLVAEGQK